MFTNLWNQITRVEAEVSDEESSLSSSKKNPLHADDIAAASLLSSFPPYGSHRKALALDNPSTNDLNGDTNITSIVSGDWDDTSPEKGKRNKVKEGLSFAGVVALFSFDDLASDDDGDNHDEQEKESGSVVSSSKKSSMAVTNRRKKLDAVSWNDDELNLWSDSKKRNDARKQKNRGNSKTKRKYSVKNRRPVELIVNEEIKRHWIYGNDVPGSGSIGADGQVSGPDVLNGDEYKKNHPIEINESDTLSTDDISSEDGNDRINVGREDTPVISNSLREQLDEKSHWMPDVLCKQCYGCEAQFTVFRRRHHCRLCGQVFCSRCSSFFVEIVTISKGQFATNLDIQPQQQQQLQDIRTIRTCKMCYEQVLESYPDVLSEQSIASSKKDAHNTTGVSTRTDPMKSIQYQEKMGGSMRSLKQFQDTINAPEHDGFRGASSNEFTNLAVVKQKLEDERIKREMAEKEQEEKSQKHHKDVLGPMKSISTITRRFGKLAESAAREAQFGDAGYNAEESILVGTGVRKEEDKE
jgi:hypothetical protein